MDAQEDHHAETTDEVQRLSRKSLRVLEMWMDVAAASIKSPGKLSGSELNRTGELLMAAHQRLVAEEGRLQAQNRTKMFMARWPTR